MKVIELLTKIANGEEVPLIKYRDKILHWNKEKNRFEDNDGMNTLYEMDFSELNDKVEIIEGQKEETKTTMRESIEELGYACGEIQKCFTNGWEKSLKNKSLNEEDKKIEKIGIIRYSETPTEAILHKKIDEIIDYINGGTNGK